MIKQKRLSFDDGEIVEPQKKDSLPPSTKAQNDASRG